MKVITLLNEKGGVGKTTSASAIAAKLAAMGFNVCLIDADTQGHATYRLKQKKADGMLGIFGLSQRWQNHLVPITPEYYGGNGEEPLLWIVPGDAGTRKVDEILNARYLIKRLTEVNNVFDFVVFDTSPRIGNIHAALFVASDYIIIPTECTRLSVDGVVSTIRHLQHAPNTVPDDLKVAKILGILPTKFNGSKKVHYQNLGWLDGRYGEDIPLFSPIRFLTDWEKSEALRIPIHMYNPRSNAAHDLHVVVGEILARIGVSEYV